MFRMLLCAALTAVSTARKLPKAVVINLPKHEARFEGVKRELAEARQRDGLQSEETQQQSLKRRNSRVRRGQRLATGECVECSSIDRCCAQNAAAIKAHIFGDISSIIGPVGPCRVNQS